MKIISKKDFDYIISEITAGMVMHVKDEVDKAWNEASKRANMIVKKYRDGEGLFQRSE